MNKKDILDQINRLETSLNGMRAELNVLRDLVGQDDKEYAIQCRFKDDRRWGFLKDLTCAGVAVYKSFETAQRESASRKTRFPNWRYRIVCRDADRKYANVVCGWKLWK